MPELNDLIYNRSVIAAASTVTTLATDVYNATATATAVAANVAAAIQVGATGHDGYMPESCREEYTPNDDHTLLDFWLSGVLLNFIGVIGIAGNILSMLILSRPQMRSSINYLLIGLARCDTVLIVTSMLLFGFRSIYPYTGYLFEYNYYIYPHIAPYVFPLATASQTASIYLTLMVSLERYVAVCHPLRAVSTNN